jgi:hypothetical protein
MTASKTSMAGASARTCFCWQVETNHTHQEGKQSVEGTQGSHPEGVSDTHGLPPQRESAPDFTPTYPGVLEPGRISRFDRRCRMLELPGAIKVMAAQPV